MARPSVGPKIEIRLPADLIARLDSQRGSRTRARYVRDVLTRHLDVTGKHSPDVRDAAELRAAVSQVTRERQEAGGKALQAAMLLCLCDHPMSKHPIDGSGGRGACRLCPCRVFRQKAGA